MSTKEKIAELVSDTCKSAADMSHGLKNVGDGDMKAGINTIIEYSEGEGMKKGGIIGAVITVSVIAVATGVKKLYLWNKSQKEKEEKIVKGFEQAKVDSLKEAHSGRDDEVICQQ